ncbi:uncharacterized protein LOC109612283 [Musca domestica]|uniref:Uncharacterized protein LOC109612283 n=1 Tax=Musca domestica TaxID=7370 RepID=A0A9J7DF58_MUSDO|nr:uncharacterized protein LOC109612283 [Musca domestica]
MCAYEINQERLMALLSDVDMDQEENIGGESSGESSDEEIMSNHDSGSEQEFDKNEDNDVVQYIGKDGSIWQNVPFPKTRATAENIFTNAPKVTATSQNVTTPFESWAIFFNFVDLVVEKTNIYILKVQVKYKDLKNARLTRRDEINALFGLLYIGGLHKSSHVNVRDLWASDGTGLEIFIATMSFNRFLFLMRCIRFDDVNTRMERRKLDKLAPIREIFEMFNQNCEKNFSCGSYITVDEKLEGFRGRCSFRQYIPNKPAKYGIKIFSAVDSTTYYTSKLEIYCGQQPLGPYNLSNKAEAVVRRIIQHLQNSGRNITTDNWFKSYSLAEYLLEKKTTLVGTIRKNKRVLPPSFSQPKNREVKSTIFGFRKKSTILSYIPKRNKCVLLLSTFHRDGKILDGPKCLPEIVEFYNKTKGGVDTTDQLCATYNVARTSNRWPLLVFYSLMNLAAINARIVLLCTKNPPLKYKKRSLFIKDLAFSLIAPQIEKRSKISTLSNNLKLSCQKFAKKFCANIDEQQNISPPAIRLKQSRCQVCGNAKDRKTKTTCCKCEIFICKSHTNPLCTYCYGPALQDTNLIYDDMFTCCNE